MIVYAIVDVRSSPDHPLGDAVETFVRREDAERFIEEVRDDEPDLASCLLRIELLRFWLSPRIGASRERRFSDGGPGGGAESRRRRGRTTRFTAAPRGVRAPWLEA
ncbi:MAG: hypothetical protein OEW52_13350, partial [Thermoleophilia bacterium]|nr:hypothetical protein [Thermoleophilia bacterium]